MLSKERERRLRKICEDGYSQDMGVYPYPGTDWYRRGDTAIRSLNPVEPQDRLRPDEVNKILGASATGVGNADDLVMGLRIQDEKKVMKAASDLLRSLGQMMMGMRIQQLGATLDTVADVLGNHPVLKNPVKL